MRHITALVVLTIVWAAMTGCTTQAIAPAPVPNVPELGFNDAHRYGARPAIPAPSELLALRPEQQAAFMAYMNDPYLQGQTPQRRVADYLLARTQGFHYQGDTLNAAEAFAVNGGNCLSLALMTTALADLAGVRIGYQLLDDLPVFEYRGTLVQKGYHVRSILYDVQLIRQDDGTMSYSRSGIKIDYFPTGQQRFVANLAREHFLAMYYRNVAGEALVAQDHATAYWYARESLRFAPDHDEAINLLAVVSRRTGDPRRAEELYRHGIAHAANKLTLLKNYQLLLRSEGRLAEAQQVQRRLDRLDDPSPFHWLQLARNALDAQQYSDSLRYFRRALEVAPYLHEAQLGVAQAQHALGDDEEAIMALRKALDSAWRPDTRKLYKAKLMALQRESL